MPRVSRKSVVLIGAGPAGLSSAACLRDGELPLVVWRDDEIEVRLGTRLDRIDRDRDGWLLSTSQGALVADDVIVAAGAQHVPFVPSWPGRERFARTLLHAADYRDAKRFRGDDVLVAGIGWSGLEIACDLVGGGAGRVRLAVGSATGIDLRESLGPLLSRLVTKLPDPWADRVMRFVRREPVDAIDTGRIEVVAGVKGLGETHVELADGTRIEPDAVIAATGYLPASATLVADAAGAVGR